MLVIQPVGKKSERWTRFMQMVREAGCDEEV